MLTSFESFLPPQVKRLDAASAIVASGGCWRREWPPLRPDLDTPHQAARQNLGKGVALVPCRQGFVVGHQVLARAPRGSLESCRRGWRTFKARALC